MSSNASKKSGTHAPRVDRGDGPRRGHQERRSRSRSRSLTHTRRRESRSSRRGRATSRRQSRVRSPWAQDRGSSPPNRLNSRSSSRSSDSSRDSSPSPITAQPKPSTKTSRKKKNTKNSKRRKKHARSTDDSDSEPPAKVSRSTKHPVYAVGLIWGRQAELWRDAEAIILEGISRDPEAEDDPDNHTAEDNALFDCYADLLELCPKLPEYLDAWGEDGAAICAKYLNDGRKSSRSSDIHGVKGNIGKWRQMDPPFPGDKDRKMAGFYHPVCGFLICPANLDWSDEKIQQGLRDHKIAALPADFPYFLYANEKVSEVDMFLGFLRNLLLVQAYLHIFVGPSAALREDGGSQHKGNAVLHGVKAVSIPSIAYVATILRYVLSSQASFDAGDKGRWPHRKFYREIIAMVDCMTKRDRDNLLKWWNEKIFKGESDCVESSSTSGEPTVASKMREQAAAKIRAEKEARIARRAEEARKRKEEEEARKAAEGQTGPEAEVAAAAVAAREPLRDTSMNTT